MARQVGVYPREYYPEACSPLDVDCVDRNLQRQALRMAWDDTARAEQLFEAQLRDWELNNRQRLALGLPLLPRPEPPRGVTVGAPGPELLPPAPPPDALPPLPFITFTPMRPAEVAALAEAARKGIGRRFVLGPAPVPTGEPISTLIIAGITAVISIFRLFGGGKVKELAKNVDALRSSYIQTTQVLTRFAWRIAGALGVVLSAVQTFWVRILRPLLQKVEAILNKVNRVIDRVLRPYLKLIAQIQRALLDIYERFFRPLLVTIQTLRRMVAILRILRVPFADKLDQRLARIEQKIAEPYFALLDKVNEAVGWLNILLSVRGVLQDGIFTRTLGSYADHAAGWWWEAHTRRFDPALRRDLYPRGVPGAIARADAEPQELLRRGTGPLAAPIERMLADLRRVTSGA